MNTTLQTISRITAEFFPFLLKKIYLVAADDPRTSELANQLANSWALRVTETFNNTPPVIYHHWEFRLPEDIHVFSIEAFLRD